MNYDEIVRYLQQYGSEELARELTERMMPYLPEEDRVLPAAALCRRVLPRCALATETEMDRCALLLSSAMNPKRADKIHPAFSELLWQLSEEDCQVLRDMMQCSVPVIDVILCKVQRQKGSFLSESVEIPSTIRELVPRLTARIPENGDVIGVQVSFDNLLRLGLITLWRDEGTREPSDVQEEEYENVYLMYADMIAQTEKNYRENHSAYRDAQTRLRTGAFVLTAMGRRFTRFCLESNGFS